MDDNISDLDYISHSSTRNTIFDNLVKNENNFTELLCNMMRFNKFKKIFLEYLGSNNNDIFIETQRKSDKNGKPDLFIKYEDGYEIIEVKTQNSGLTRNQPKGYIKELIEKDVTTKKLHFLIPKNYSHLEKLKNKIENVKEKGKLLFNKNKGYYSVTYNYDKEKDKKITIEIKSWEDFFEYCKGKYIIFKSNKILLEYYNLLKSWFGYETIIIQKGEKNIMKKKLEKLSKVFDILDSIYCLLKKHKELKLESNKSFDQIGFNIIDKNKKIFYGWIGIWFPLLKENDHIFIYTPNNEDKKIKNNFLKIYKNECKVYKDQYDDNKEYKYICFDNDIFNKNKSSDIIGEKILDIIKNANTSKMSST